MDPEARAKYLNGPETGLFHKGSTLYGLGEARRLQSAGGQGTSVVVVEGYMDAIACQRANIPAVAPLGTALTEEQMEALWRLDPEPVLCFDGDGAGQRAASRAIDRALPMLKPGRSFKFAILTGGKDPDDVLRDQGAAALKAQLAKTTPFVEALFTRERDLETLDTPERPSRRACALPPPRSPTRSWRAPIATTSITASTPCSAPRRRRRGRPRVRHGAAIRAGRPMPTRRSPPRAARPAAPFAARRSQCPPR
jgi:DNA primase